MSEVDPVVEAAARALVAKYREIWPGEWPAFTEATSLALAAIAAYKAARPAEGVVHVTKNGPYTNTSSVRIEEVDELTHFTYETGPEIHTGLRVPYQAQSGTARPAVDEAMVERATAQGIDPVWLTAAGAKSVLREMEHFLSDPASGLVNGIYKAHLRHWHAALTAALRRLGMPKFRKKPVVIEASQWFKNGDHPLDYVEDHHDFKEAAVVTTYTGEYRKAMGWEGDVVRYYRHPDVPGDKPCEQCGKPHQVHGWIDTLEQGHRVCPGDWIITGVKGERYPCKPDIFEATYEPEPTP